MRLYLTAILAQWLSRQDRRGRREQKHAPAAIGEPDQQTESDKNAKKSHASDLFQQGIDVHGRAAPEIRCMRI